MLTFTTAAELQTHLRSLSGTIAYVPTMGALHAGHLALIRAAGRAHDHVVASIFVNPTQFNEAADLDAYPRTPEADADLLKGEGCDVLYLPDVADVYPNGTAPGPTARLDFGNLTTSMEGANRPGHFAGVAQVVHRLLDVVRPNTLFLGQKDYQQVAVIRSMIDQMELNVAVEVVPTVREADGLAMSSRNRRLDATAREAAGRINKHLEAVRAGLLAGWPPRILEGLALAALEADPALRAEYLDIRNGETLERFVPGEPFKSVVVATAAWCGGVRLIDNVTIG